MILIKLEESLVLEKNTLVKEKARYKIIDISNEAPDYIKRKKLPFGTITNLKVFTNTASNFPFEGNDSFTFSTNEILLSINEFEIIKFKF